MSKFRIYVKPGCPFCDSVKQLFADSGVPVELIEVGNDPVIAAGLRAIENVLMFTVPVTIAFETNQVIVGFKPDELRRAINLYSGSRTVAPSTPVSVG